MKTQIIKTWTKYLSSTLAIAGLLTLGSCDSNTTNREQPNYENEVEAAENEIGDPNRDNVNREIDAESYDTDDNSGQPARVEGQEANPTEDTVSNQQRRQENQR